jgi:hypothetical protein
MKHSATVLVVLLLAGCSAPGEREEDNDRPPGSRGRAPAEEIRAYIAAAKPEEVHAVRFKEPLRWTYLNNYFVLMEARKGPHLVELAWECKDLRASAGIYSDMADRREKRGVLRANIDTLRGCRIETFYKLPAVDAVEDDSEPGAE